MAPPDIKRLTATGKFVATPKGYEESVWSTTLECNMRNPLFAKRDVRQAMFLAVDRNLIAKTVYYGYARPGTSPIYSPNKEFFTADTYKTTYDPKKAAALLDAAGSKAERVRMFKLYDPPEFEAAKAADRELYRRGQPNALDLPG